MTSRRNEHNEQNEHKQRAGRARWAGVSDDERKAKMAALVERRRQKKAERDFQKLAEAAQTSPEPVAAPITPSSVGSPQGDPVAPSTEPAVDSVAAEPHPVNLQAAESPSAESPFGPWLPCIVTAVDAPFPGWISFKDYPAGGVQSQPRARFEWLHGPVAWLTVQPEPVPTPGRGPAREADRFDYDQEGDRLPSAFVRLMDTGDVDVHAGKIFRQ